MTDMFDPIQIRDISIPNRVWMSPMCMYSAEPQDGLAGKPNSFHFAHYAARAAGGVGLVMVEATAVVAEGRITPFDLGIWEDGQVEHFARVVQETRLGGAIAGIQLAHAGRKASCDRPWNDEGEAGGDENYLGEQDFGWHPVAPSPVAFPGLPVPLELTTQQIAEVVQAFAQAARRAEAAGFDVVEIHAAHGYLLHSFLSPVSNKRTDEYGGSLENRVRIVLEVIDAVRAVWPDGKPVFMRVSTTDWIEENPGDPREAWTVQQTVQLAEWARDRGVDLIDASSGGLEVVQIPRENDYQTKNAAVVRARTGMPTAAVGRIWSPERVKKLIESEQADAVFLGRALLRDPSWANSAAERFGVEPRFVKQYSYTL